MPIGKRLHEKRHEEQMRAVQGTGTDPAVLAAAGSVVLSWYFYFVKGNRHAGLFVGLWAPTILAFGSYFKQTRMSKRLRRSSVIGDIADAIQRLSKQGE